MHRYLSYNTMSLRGGLNAVLKSKCMIILAILQGRLFVQCLCILCRGLQRKYWLRTNHIKWCIGYLRSHQMVHWLLAITSDGALATCDPSNGALATCDHIR